MPVEMIAEEVLASETSRLRLVPPLPDPEPRVVIQRVFPDAEMLKVLTLLGNILAVRMMLLLAVSGAFVLAWRAQGHPDGIWVMIAFAFLVVGPLCYLAQRRS